MGENAVGWLNGAMFSPRFPRVQRQVKRDGAPVVAGGRSQTAPLRMCVLLMCVMSHLMAAPEKDAFVDIPEVGSTLRVLTPEVLEIEWIQPNSTEQGAGSREEKNRSQKTGTGRNSSGTSGSLLPAPRSLLATPASSVVIPRPEQLAVTVGGEKAGVKTVGLKRRAVYAPLDGHELRVGTWLYLQLEQPITDDAAVAVANPAGDLWDAGVVLAAKAERGRESPAIHVNQVGYLPGQAKEAMVGYYLGSLGELAVPADAGFAVIDARGAKVFEGKLKLRADRGYAYSPTPYQQVYSADFTAFRTPGEYRLSVPGLGVSLPFRVDEAAALALARTYALGVYHQRCGTENALPYTRFVHAACHVALAQVPVPAADFPFTWKTLATHTKEAPRPVADESALLFPFVHHGTRDVAGGHHDAGDYSKYTINSAAFVHTLIFAVDALPGVADADNLGLPESGDGISDVLQEAKWESDFLAKLQDDDGGFYFLVYPRERPYEGDVLPDHGDPQVVWPKSTAATAAAVAALAQAGSSPRFRKTYPREAADYLQRAVRGWKFLMNAIAQHGKEGAYQRFTHYGDDYGHDDELAWAAAELFLATGDAEYHDKFRAWCDPANAQTRRWGWWRMNEAWGNAIRSYAFGVRSGRLPGGRLDAPLEEKCRREIEAAANDALRDSDDSAYGTSFPSQTKRMKGGGWYFSLDRAFDLAVASALDYPRGNDPRPAFLEAYLANVNYEAGVNPLNLSYVTGVGHHRVRDIVHQYAVNDRRAFPPVGLPVGNLQAGQPYLPAYKGELGALSFPEDGAAVAPYPYYDRWTDTHNVSTEFVIVNQARALAGLVWLAGQTKAARQPWRPTAGKITGLPEKGEPGASATVRFVPPAGMDLAEADVTWESSGKRAGHGATFEFTPGGVGAQWVEAEAAWPDGRRVFAMAERADQRAAVTISAPQAVASVPGNSRAVFRFHRTGDTSAPLKVHFVLEGTAAKWSDYRRPEGDMPVEMVIPAGRDSVDMTILPMAAGLGGATRELRITVKPDEAYQVGPQRSASAKLIGKAGG